MGEGGGRREEEEGGLRAEVDDEASPETTASETTSPAPPFVCLFSSPPLSSFAIFVTTFISHPPPAPCTLTHSVAELSPMSLTSTTAQPSASICWLPSAASTTA